MALKTVIYQTLELQLSGKKKKKSFEKQSSYTSSLLISYGTVLVLVNYKVTEHKASLN